MCLTGLVYSHNDHNILEIYYILYYIILFFFPAPAMSLLNIASKHLKLVRSNSMVIGLA